MIKKYFTLLFIVFFFADIFAETVDIDIPDVIFSYKNGSVVPRIKGFELDGTAEETILPFKKMVFGSDVVKVEILKQHKITLEAPLRKGSPLYRMSDMRKVDKTAFEARKIPSISEFTFDHFSTFKRTQPLFGFNFYPLIPVNEKEVIKIDRIRVTTKGKSLLPMTNTKSRNSLLILTTNYFLTESKEIANYIKAKKESGFRVSVATETNYDGGKLRGLKRVEKIREYLKSVYKNYDFLLIIAGTDTDGDEVPMVITTPCKTDEPDYDDVPTDIFYAELTENMDKNENGVYGESKDKIRYAFELIVGRIPIYGKNVKNADLILARTIDFIKEKPSTAEYRRRILFPSTISYYENQDNQLGIPKMDGAYIAEYLRNNSITEPFSSKLLVEKSGIDPSEFVDEDALNYSSMLANMNTGNGIVFWQGHGMPTYSVRTIWSKDRNNNEIPETYNYELFSDTFVDNDTAQKTTAQNSFVFQGSCLNGTIEGNGSLAYNFLKNTSVGVVGASQVSYGSVYSDYDLWSQDIFSYGTVFTDAAIKNEIPAQVLFDTKEVWSDYSVLLTDKLETNYIGDPSLKLNVQTCESDGDCDDGIFCNGSEKCVDGFCETDIDSLPCTDSGKECEENFCDETTKSCKTSPMLDGSFCGVPENACVGGKQCFSGKCIDVDYKDCSQFDSECSSGSCDPETGECVLVPEKEGESCSSGNLCLKNEVCTKGFCEGEKADIPEARECYKTECTESEGFFEIADISQNWNDCTTSDGKQGYCDYGACTPKKEQKKESSSSGCSVTVF
ncbi:hypothetical protein J5681_07180 [bacterium]|nr:hypothetical protein [bacterium]